MDRISLYFGTRILHSPVSNKKFCLSKKSCFLYTEFMFLPSDIEGKIAFPSLRGNIISQIPLYILHFPHVNIEQPLNLSLHVASSMLWILTSNRSDLMTTKFRAEELLKPNFSTPKPFEKTCLLNSRLKVNMWLPAQKCYGHKGNN